MSASSTPTYHGYEHGPANVVSPYITLGILVAGVVGGLVIVIAVILFCKYCVTKTQGLRRDQGTDCERSSDRRFKPFQRYETINSDIFSEPSTGSMDGIPISPRKLFEAKSHEKLSGTEEVNETTKLKSDFDKASYKDVECDEACEFVPNEEDDEEEEEEEQAAIGGKVPVPLSRRAEEGEVDGRRVSFHVDTLPPSPSTYLRKGRRYTEGDFHYLKKIRIDKKVPHVPRQYSVGSALLRGSSRHIEVIELTPIPSADESGGHEDLDYNQTHALSLALDSPSPSNGPIATQVAVDVEVHYRDSVSRDIANNNIPAGTYSYSKPSVSPSSRKQVNGLKPHSVSMDVVSPTDTITRTNRRVKSYDDVAEYDYDVLKITEFSKGPFFNNGFEAISEMDSPCSSKVRYNDMGSLEVLNEEKLDYYDDFEFENNIIPDESDDTETLNGTQKYRELWNLRTTLEEEEECSDTIRMEDMTSPDEQSPDREQPLAYKPFYDASVEAAQFSTNNKSPSPHPDSEVQPSSSSNYLHPNYENRRENYKRILTRRFQKRGSTSAENSFDSVETADTDGDVSDTSRQEVTTTSFESTTDNTDSTNDSQTNRLRQMKADSGYKSLETQQPPGQGSNGVKKSAEDEITVLESSCQEEGRQIVAVTPAAPVAEPSSRRNKFEKRNGRTASKRRREYSRERQMVRLYDSIYEPETDSKSDQPSGDSFEEPNVPSKFSVFSRFFKSQRHSRERSLTRDFSIDEKSNDIFQEFVRYDPKLETRRGSSAGLSTTGKQHRLQRKYTDPGPGVFEGRVRRDRLAPDMRSTSLGSDSSASSARRISPQDSIEEEEYEEDIDAAVMRHKNSLREASCVVEVPTPSLSIHEIPIIKLPDGEAADV